MEQETARTTKATARAPTPARRAASPPDGGGGPSPLSRGARSPSRPPVRPMPRHQLPTRVKNEHVSSSPVLPHVHVHIMFDVLTSYSHVLTSRARLCLCRGGAGVGGGPAALARREGPAVGRGEQARRAGAACLLRALPADLRAAAQSMYMPLVGLSCDLASNEPCSACVVR